MEHNQQLIQIINELNAKEARNKSASVNLKQKSNSVKNIVEELPSNGSDVLKSYLKKFRDFKDRVHENTDQESDNALSTLVEDVAPVQGEASFEKYSKKDSRVFTNKAKRSETQVTNLRWKQYSNSKASLTTDKNMAPLRLDKYSS